MTLTRGQFEELLRDDEEVCFPSERIPELERVARHLAPPATNLGSGRGRFWQLLRHLEPRLDQRVSLADVGAYPGTALRLVRHLPSGQETRLAAYGFDVSGEFVADLDRLDIPLHQVEFDVRRPPAGTGHLLTVPLDSLFDIVLCSEVLEHQLHPAALLVGLHRITRPGGEAVVTTNSVSFVGDIARLLIGHHNVEPLERSHVLSDSAWRPHVRLFTRDELVNLFVLAGFAPEAAFYFDNGNVYAGPKGEAIKLVRRAAGMVPHFRSHVFITAKRTGEPHPRLLGHLRNLLHLTGLEELAPAAGRTV
jgi:SAM-dependent methyltransferase